VYEGTALGNARVRIGRLRFLDHCAVGFWLSGPSQRRFARRGNRDRFWHSLFGFYRGSTGYRIFIASNDAARRAVGGCWLLPDIGTAIDRNQASVTKANGFAIARHF